MTSSPFIAATSLRESPEPKLFIGWSGAKSKAIAECVHRMIDTVFDDAQPFISSQTIEEGPWNRALQGALDSAQLGAVFLSSENLHNTSIHFEVGVLRGRDVPIFS